MRSCSNKMSGIQGEMTALLTAFLTGSVLMLVYDMLRLFRRKVPHRHWVIQMEDLIFWIAAAIFIFVQMFRTNYGSIRWYFVCGGALGAVFTGRVLWFFEKKIKKIANYLKKNNKGTKIN